MAGHRSRAHYRPTTATLPGPVRAGAGHTASFYEGLDPDLRVLDPAKATVVADDSPHYRRSRLWLEATPCKTAVPLNGTALTVNGNMLADVTA